jgi:subtilisin-like proprotein convertase family protein
MRKGLYLAIAVFAMFGASTLNGDVVDNTGAGFSIPDGVIAGASSSINIATNETINGNVELTIRGFTHTWVGDIVATLTGPGGSATILFRTGEPGAGFGDSSNLNGVYTFSDDGANIWAVANSGNSLFDIPSGDYQASSTGPIGVGSPVLLNPVFFGDSTAGTWTLTISDRVAGDVGAITGWGISLQSFAIPEPGFALFGLTGLGLVVRRRR